MYALGPEYSGVGKKLPFTNPYEQPGFEQYNKNHSCLMHRDLHLCSEAISASKGFARKVFPTWCSSPSVAVCMHFKGVQSRTLLIICTQKK